MSMNGFIQAVTYRQIKALRRDQDLVLDVIRGKAETFAGEPLPDDPLELSHMWDVLTRMLWSLGEEQAAAGKDHTYEIEPDDHPDDVRVEDGEAERDAEEDDQDEEDGEDEDDEDEDDEDDEDEDDEDEEDEDDEDDDFDGADTEQFPPYGLLAGEEVGVDLGYGVPCLRPVAATRAFARFLEALSLEELLARVSYRELHEHKVFGKTYGFPRDSASGEAYEAEVREELTQHYPELRDYVMAAAAARQGLLGWME